MNKEELDKKVNQLKLDKKPVKMTKRDFVNALGCEKRTSGNVSYINRYLNNNNIITVPSYVDGWIDEEMELRFKYEIKHSHFQLYHLWIEHFKNLNDFTVDFENTNEYCTFIGLNGSGKSNVLEAISAIFYHLYSNTSCPFKYKISYIINGAFYSIINGKTDNQPVKPEQLPKNVVASYSGEDDRMWQSYYYPIYEKYCQKIGEMPNIATPQMLYVGKEQWHISFLTLLYARDKNADIDMFLKSIIGDANCTIEFVYNDANLNAWKETIGKSFVKSLKSKSSYAATDFVQHIDGCEVEENESAKKNVGLSYVNDSSTLFNLLYQATVERGTNPIDDIKIKIDHYGSLKELSEGEKKMIVVCTIMNVLSSEKSFCIFDEPDSHVHISRKKEMLDIINTRNRYSVLTTHSPVFLDLVSDDTNVRFMNNGRVELTDKLKQIQSLSGGTINYFEGAFILSAKNILVTEGKYDGKYLRKAIDVFSKRDSKYKKLSSIAIMQAGSAGNAKAIYEEVLSGLEIHANKIVFLFDYDKGGLDGWKAIDSIKNSKIEPIFYQEDYCTMYSTSVEKIASKDSYMVEDLFSSESYKEKVEYVHKKNTHKEFRCNDQGRTDEAIKHHIENNYQKFKDSWFDGFKPLLDKLLELFGM